MAHRRLVWLMLFFIEMAFADIYKWQDENGKWHFSDTPVKGQAVETIESIETSQTSEENLAETEILKNLEEKLVEHYKPRSAIEKVTMGVVTVKTAMGLGSGFFITDQGHLVTNKHVVRPTHMKKYWDREQEDWHRKKQLVDKDQSRMQKEQNYLKGLEKKLAEYKVKLKSEPDGINKKLMQDDYEEWLAYYQERKKNYDKNYKVFVEQKRKFDQAYSDMNLNSSLSAVATRFKILLKDKTELTATLISISEDQDLALLQVEGYRTPKLLLKEKQAPRQGMQVYAVGSPWGNSDSVTAGIVTHVNKNHIITDAKILPGNSGGPLVDDQGRVIGVNTLKYSEDQSQGFGMAIPAKRILSEFQKFLPPGNSE